MTEPLFLVTGAASVLILLSRRAQYSRARTIIAALMGGACLLTRFLGVAFVTAGCAILLATPGRPVRHRLLRTVEYAVLSLAPLGIWLSYLSAVPGGEAPRGVLVPVHIWASLAPFRIAVLETTWNWLGLGAISATMGYRASMGAFGALLILLCVSFAWQLAETGEFKDVHRTQALRIGLATFVFLIAYLLSFALSYVLFDPPPPFNDRLLFPVPLAVAILGIVCAWTLMRRAGWAHAGRVIGLAGVGLAVLQSGASLDYARRLWVEGEGYTSARWRTSGTIAEVTRLNPNTPLVSNDSAAILFLAGRPAFDLPELALSEPVPDLSTPFGLGSSMADRQFREEGGALVLFDHALWQLAAIYGEAADLRLQGLTRGLILQADSWDGKIYVYPKGNGSALAH